MTMEQMFKLLFILIAFIVFLTVLSSLDEYQNKTGEL